METEKRTPHWIPCPVCKETTDVKVYADTVLINYPLSCPHCKQGTLINVVQLKIVTVSPEKS